MKKKIVVVNMNDVIPDLSEFFELVSPVQMQQASALILAHDILHLNKEYCASAKRFNIPSFVVQHGRYAASDYSVKRRKPRADYFLAWGEHDVEEATDGGWDKSKVVRIGSPLFEYRCSPAPDGKTVVFAPLHRSSLHDMEKRNRDEAVRIWKEMQGIEGINPIAKLLLNEHDLDSYPGTKFITSREEEGHIGRVYKDLLKKTSCVVSQKEGTFELLAYSMGIPVVRIENIHSTDPYPASRVCKLGELRYSIKLCLTTPDQDATRRMETIIQTGGSDGDTPKESIIRLIREKSC